MKISVVTAVYNRQATIVQALESFSAQDWSDKEQVIIDGRSTDGTLDLIKTHAQPGAVIVSEPDNGIYDAINKGIKAATGDVIGLLHSDDRFADTTVLTEIAQAFQDPSVDVVFADAGFFESAAPDRVVRRYNSGRFSRDAIARGWMPAHTTMYARRRVFDSFGLYKTDYHIAADFEFVARIFGKGGATYRYVPKVWMLMQTGGASTNGLGAKITLNREVLRACRENGIRTSYLRILSKYPAKILERFQR